MADGIVLTPELFARISRAVRWAESQQGGQSVFDGQHAPPLATFLNDTGETIPAYGLFYDNAISVSQNHPIVTAQKPTTTFKQFYYVNGDRDVEDGDYGQYQTSNMVRLAYDSGTPAFNDWYGAKPSQFTASKNYPGQFICRGIIDSTDKIMWARDAGPVTTLIGKLAGSLSQGNTATVNVWAGAGGSEAVVTSMTLTGRDWLMKSGATSIASGKKVILQWINGVIYVEEAECA